MSDVSHSCRVLVVDDDPMIRSLIRALLEDEGAVVAEAKHGAQALLRLEQEEFSLLILDLNMPVMDGTRLAKRLRDDGNRIPMVVISAHDAQRVGRELGAAHALDKPFDIDELVSVVLTICHAATTQDPETAVVETGATEDTQSGLGPPSMN